MKKIINIIIKFFWFYLNDSIYLSYNLEYPIEQKYYPKWIWNSKSDFLKSYWFSAIRNSGINALNYIAFIVVGKFIRTLKHYGNDKNFIEIRQFEHKTLPAFNFNLFGKKFFIGYAKSGRFWIELFK